MEEGIHKIPEITETIVVDEQLHVQLFKKSIPIPLPEWFRKGGHCEVKKKSIFENFPAYIRNYGEIDKEALDPNDIPHEIMAELQQIQYKNPKDGPKFSSSLLRYALLLYYTSPQAYRLLLEQFPMPSISLLKKLSRGGVDSLKAVKVLLEQEKIDKDIVLLLDEIYLQKDVDYSGGKMIGCDEDGNMFKGVMTFMINSLKDSIPFVVRAVPEKEITGKWIAKQINELLSSLHECGFHVRAVISDNHSTNVAAFKLLENAYGITGSPDTITHPSRENSKIYLFYDSVHLLKNIRNNLVNARRFRFPSFNFCKFYDEIRVPGGEISWKKLHDVYDRDQKLPAYLRKAPKLSYKCLHPGDNKQSVPLALGIFDRSTAVAIAEYFPESCDASEFLKLVNTWWIISNSKQQYNQSWRLGNAAVSGDHKPEFLRKFAEWIEEWQDQSSKCLTPQTSEALITTLRCTASLIEDLLAEGYQFVLTARFQTDPLERRFSRHRQMSGGRFLIGLRELESSERILAISSLIKEDIDFWKEDIRPADNKSLLITALNSELDRIAEDIDVCMLSPEGVQVSAVIAGYAVRKLIMDRSECAECEHIAVSKEEDETQYENKYLINLSRGGLVIPTMDLRHHVAKSFAILELCQHIIRDSDLAERTAAMIALQRNDQPMTFFCSEHKGFVSTLNRTVANVFFNNARKEIRDTSRKDKVRDYKIRYSKRNVME